MNHNNNTSPTSSSSSTTAPAPLNDNTNIELLITNAEVEEFILRILRQPSLLSQSEYDMDSFGIIIHSLSRPICMTRNSCMNDANDSDDSDSDCDNNDG